MSQNGARLVSGGLPTGQAGGDLSATYPNPTAAKLQNNAIKSQTLGAGQDTYQLAWINANNQWEATPTSTINIQMLGAMSASGSWSGGAGGVYYKIPFSTPIKGTNITLDTVNNSMVIVHPAIYKISASIFFANIMETEFFVSIFKNGNLAFTGCESYGTTSSHVVVIDTIMTLAANDVIDIRVMGSVSGNADSTFTILKIK